MPERTLDARYRLLGATFRDGARAGAWRERLGPQFQQALDLLLHVLAGDLALAPPELDREHVRHLLATLLPGRLAGDERYRHDLPDLLEDFLMCVAEEEGLTTQWEWTSSIGEARADYERALENPERPSLAPLRHEPDRRPAAKIGRNDPCPCGSGRKYKHCCLRLL